MPKKLEDILTSDPALWTDENRNVILKAKSAKGHQYVKTLRDRLNKPEPIPEPPNEE